MKGLGKFSQDASAVTYSLSGLFRRPSGNHWRATLDRASVTLVKLPLGVFNKFKTP